MQKKDNGCFTATPLYAAFARKIPLAAALLLLVACAPYLAAQTFGSMTGAVTDASGAAVPNAIVTATFVNTNQKLTTKTNENGIYNLADLRDGAYTLSVTASGFQQRVVTGILLAPRQLVRQDVKLEIGTVTQETVVSAAPAVISTDSVGVGDLQTAAQLQSNPFSMILSSLFYIFTDTAAFGYAPGSGTNPSFAGSRAGEYNIDFDGVNTMGITGSSNGINMVGQDDWIQETKADYVNNSAQFGQLAEMQLVSKSGSNAVHGQAFWYYADAGLTNARSPFTFVTPVGIVNAVGFDLGGPVYIPKVYNGKNKTFFFLHFFDRPGNGGQLVVTNTVPLAPWRTGDFSALGIPIKNPVTGQVYANGMIPQNSLSPISVALQNEFWPLPNFGNTSAFATGNFRTTLVTPPGKTQQPVLRMDQDLGSKDYLYASFIYLRSVIELNNNGGFPLNNFSTFEARPEKVYTIDYAHTFTPALVNEFKFGGSSDVAKYQPPQGNSGLAFDQSLGITGVAAGVPANLPGYPGIGFSSLGITAIGETYPYTRSVLASQHFQDNLNYFHGKHAFTFGMDIGRYWQYSIGAASNLFGSATFAPQYSVSGTSNPDLAYADFLFGTPLSSSIAYAPVASNPHRVSQAYFATDTWKVAPNLTLILGLRYEYTGLFSDSNNEISEFDPANSSIVVPGGALPKVNPLMPTSYIPIVTTSAANLPSNLIYGDKNNFAPRLGVAYRPFGDKTVFRAGYGIFYDIVPQEPAVAGVPFSISVPAYTNTTPNPTLVFPQIFPLAGTGGPSTVSIPGYINPHIAIPYTQQWNFTVERQEGAFGLRATMLGTYGRQMVWASSINVPAANAIPYINKPRPFPNYPNITEAVNGENHNYNAFNFSVTRRLSHGLSLSSNFVWARDIGDDIVSPENPYCISCERGLNNFVSRLTWSTNGIYQLPFGHGQRFLSNSPKAVNTAIGGWQLTLMYFAGTGGTLTPTETIPDPLNITYTTNSTDPQVSMRPDTLMNPVLPNRTLQQWFNTGLNTATGAWATPPPGRIGDASRGLIVGPGQNIWHSDLQKTVAFSDNPSVPVLRLDFYMLNVFNHPNWGNPNVNLSTPASAGIITALGGTGTASGSFGSDAGTERYIRFSARILW